MHKFAQMPSPQAAQLFASYCISKGLEVSAVVQQDNLAELYASEEQLELIESEFNRFIQEPYHERYQAAAWQVSKLDVKPQDTDAVPRVNWQRFLLLTPLTALIFLACLVVYGWQQFDWRTIGGALQLTDPTQIWRWFTPMLLHFSLTHLVFNLAWWVYLGRQFERHLGSMMLLNVSLSIALISNAAQYFMVNPYFGGLSGVVYGLFGYFWIAGRLNPSQGLYMSPGLIGFMLLWLALGFFDVLWVNMANWAHLGGLVAGMAWAWLLRKQPSRLLG